MSQVLLTLYLSLFGRQFFEQRSFLPDAMKSKKRFEHVSPYLNHVDALSWWFRATCSCRKSAMCPCTDERMLLTASSLGSSCNRISANRVFCWRPLIRAPFSRFLSFASLPLHLSTLFVAASNHPNQSASWPGGGWVPSHASRRAALHTSSFSRDMSKYAVVLGGAEGRPQTIKTNGEWSEIFLMDGAASILPPLESSS